jgi:hypothetical protein
MPTIASDLKSRAFDVALRTREFELDLFWKRALFFWGFVAATFAGYAAAKERPALGVLLACFGWVCSLAWTLANRGSKYWYENWETKIEKMEREVTGLLFSVSEKPQAKGTWLSGRRYSVSKLAIGLSDYVVLFWTVILVKGSIDTLFPGLVSSDVARLGLWLIVPGSFIFGVLLARKSKST